MIVTVPKDAVILGVEKLEPSIEEFIANELILDELKLLGSETTTKPSPTSKSLFGLGLYKASGSDTTGLGSICGAFGSKQSGHVLRLFHSSRSSCYLYSKPHQSQIAFANFPRA